MEHEAIIIYDYYIKVFKLKGAQLMIYAVLVHECQKNKNRCCYCTMKYLAQKTGYSDRKVFDAISSLLRKGYIERKPVPTRFYFLNNLTYNESENSFYKEDTGEQIRTQSNYKYRITPLHKLHN